MINVLTPAGFALCAALGVESCSFANLFAAATNPNVPQQYRYEMLTGCTDQQFETLPICGKEMDCVVISMFVRDDGTPGLDRLCRKRREPTS